VLDPGERVLVNFSGPFCEFLYVDEEKGIMFSGLFGENGGNSQSMMPVTLPFSATKMLDSCKSEWTRKISGSLRLTYLRRVYVRYS